MFFIFNHERKPDDLLPVEVEEYVLGTVRKSVRQQQEKTTFATGLSQEELEELQKD